MKRWLDQEVYRYTGENAYPFHIPGAKRINIGLDDPFRYDITEIGGFDDLRHASGLLAELEQEWGRMYGAGKAFLSVNGSTCGNLAVIFASTKQHDRILAADGCHWSVRNAAKLRELSVGWLAVEQSAEGFCEAVTAEEVERAFANDSGIRAIVITSPTYEGMVAEVSRIAEIAHSHGAALLVDSAHGAHLGLRLGSQMDGMREMSFPNPVTQGADAVVVSLHKTLPVLGQVSLILLPDSDQPWVRADEVKRYLNMFQTSSPSYLLMSSAAAGCRFLQEHGAGRYREFIHLLAEFYEKTSGLKQFRILKKDNQDLSKIIISTINANISGQELMTALREDYQIELEKAGGKYALALAGIMDRKEGFDRLADALYELDGRYCGKAL